METQSTLQQTPQKKQQPPLPITMPNRYTFFPIYFQEIFDLR